MKTIFDGQIEYNNDEELDILSKSMDTNLSVIILESAINYSIKMGVFNLDECFVLYNSLLKLKTHENSTLCTSNSVDSINQND